MWRAKVINTAIHKKWYLEIGKKLLSIIVLVLYALKEQPMYYEML